MTGEPIVSDYSSAVVVTGAAHVYLSITEGVAVAMIPLLPDQVDRLVRQLSAARVAVKPPEVRV